jgi:hypothetical protein
MAKFDGNGLWRAYSATGNETISLSVYNGSASITVFKKGTDNRRPAVKMNLSKGAIIRIQEILLALEKAQPDTRTPFVKMLFDKEARTYQSDVSFGFGKDTRNCYYIDVQSKFITTPIKFAVRCANSWSMGNSALSDEDKSKYGLKELIETFRELPTCINLSRIDMERLPRNNNNHGGGNNSYRGNNNGGSAHDAFQDTAPSSSDDDAVFG